MSMATLERIVLAGAKLTFKNPRLKMEDIQEWSFGDIKSHDGEVVIHVPYPGVFVAIKKENDKR